MFGINITEKKRLTKEILANIPEDVIDEDEDFLGMLLDHNDEDFANGDYIYLKLIKDNEIFKMVHGFPGDTPMGTVYKGDKFITNLSGTDDELGEFNLWYENITNGGTKYSEIFFI